MSDYRLEDEVRIPVSALRALVAAARRSGEPVAAAVRRAGLAAGEDITRHIRQVVSLSELDTNDFWAAVNAETGARGLGTFQWEGALGGHAELTVFGAADEEEAERTPNGPGAVPFTEGLIEGLLGAAVEEHVAAVQAPHDGGEGVRFILGSPTALRHVRLRLQAGASLEQALEGI